MSRSPAADDDQSLMLRVQTGEVECFSTLASRYHRPLLRLAKNRLGRAPLAEEAVQETFLAAFRGRDTFDPARSFRTWLWTILLNQCRAIGQREGQSPQAGGWTGEGDMSHGAEVYCERPTPLAELLARERGEVLEQLLRRLSPAQADALRLRFFAEMKFQEIADAMGCSLLTAKNRVKWGLLRLAELSRETLEEERSNNNESRPDDGRRGGA